MDEAETSRSQGWSAWRWPNGWLWRGALRWGTVLRKERYRRFMAFSRADASTRILDVGSTAGDAGASNLLETQYPWSTQLTACGLEDPPSICVQRGIRYVQADGCDLPFADGEFDVVHSNAVIEHVGSRERQRTFVTELCRVGRRVWIATPDAASPFEPHTLIPFAHWLAPAARNAIYRAFGRGYWADENTLNPLAGSELRALFPLDLRRRVKIHRQRILGLPTILVATLAI